MGHDRIVLYGYIETHHAVGAIARRIHDSGIQFDYVIGLVRGGCVPGVMLSHRINVPFKPLVWSTRDYASKESIEWIIDATNKGKKILLVEDIIDTGETLRSLYAALKSAHPEATINRSNIFVASLIYNTSQDVCCDFFATKIDRNSNDNWYEFFWEHKGVF